MSLFNRANVYDYITLKNIVAIQPVRLLSQFEYSSESHNFWELIYVYGGTLSLIVDSKEYIIDEGRIIFYPPNVTHSWRAVTGVCHLDVISFETNSADMKYFYDRLIALTFSEIQMFSKIFSEGIEYFDFLPAESENRGQTLRPDVSSFQLQHLKKQFELFIVELFRRTTDFDTQENIYRHHDRYSNKIYDIIVTCLQNHITESLTLEQLSKLTGISVTHMKRTFKKHYDGGIIDYYILLKVEEAKKMITETDLSFTEISDYLGFNSASYFSRTFKKKTGYSPSEYSNNTIPHLKCVQKSWTQAALPQGK